MPNSADPTWTFSDLARRAACLLGTPAAFVTFLMVFLVQHTQNRDARALHLKLDELLRSAKDARNKLIDLENCTDEALDRSSVNSWR
jgi:low affinity Fe/Cu permease